jgi:hypothetical protein
MSPFIEQCLSRTIVKTLIKGNSTLDYNKALGNVTALYRSAIGTASNEVQIPLPRDEKPRVRPEELTDVEVEQAIVPLFDYFDANLQTLNTYLSDTAKEMVMTRVWKEILVIIEGLLIPLLSDVTSDMKPLSDKEVDIVFKWLKVCYQCRVKMMRLNFFTSFCEITFTQEERVQFPWSYCKIRNIAMLYLYGCTMTGTRRVHSSFNLTCPDF